MRKRWRWVVAWLAIGPVVALAAFVLWPRPTGVKWKQLDRIRRGMTLGEVEAIVGPPGNYQTGPSTLDLTFSDPTTQAHRRWGNPAVIWASDEAHALIEFDNSGRVSEWSFIATEKTSPSAGRDTLWRAKRLWRRLFH